MNQKFVDFMRPFMPHRLAVAVSGGVDSVALLHWLHALGANIVVLHVDHGLRAAARAEAAYVQTLCGNLGIECHVFKWVGPKPDSGVEAAARDARYKLMTDFCRENGIEYLFVAHQADDQIETFLMNLARGSGLDGLAAMREITRRDGINIVRPLLGVPRRELKEYCDAHAIRYFYDEMNDDTRFARVSVRKNRYVLPEKLGITDDRILLAIRNLGRVRDALDDELARLVAVALRKDHALFSESFLFDLAPDLRLKFLGTLIVRVGGNVYRPRLNSLARALDNLGHDCKFTLGHCTVRRRGDQILIVPEGARTSFRNRDERQKKHT